MYAVTSDPSNCYEEFLLLDPAKPEKLRRVLNVKGAVRKFQERLYRKLLLPRLQPSPYSHGGIRGRSVKSNAQVHLGSQFLMKADISDFYPSVSHKRVYRLLTADLKCSPDVAGICTRICTHDYHLALGLVTSPILADTVLAKVDRRIGGICESANLRYSRYVDDITISGSFDIEQSGIPATITSILVDHGFTAHPGKWESGHTDGGPAITGVSIRNGRLDVTHEYIASVESQIDDIRCLAEGKKIVGTYATESQLLGRIAFVCWINRRRGVALRKEVKSLNWSEALKTAHELGLVEARKRLIPVLNNS